MANSAPTKRRVPVGYRFRPTEKELVAHYLRRKLKARDPSVHNTIPEIDACKLEPGDILALLANKFDDSECFFFSPYNYKYSNSARRDRRTLRGFWKVTGRGGKIIDQDTNNVIGTEKNLVFYKKHEPCALKTNWVIHEYHDATLPAHERTHALCWLKKNNEKKTKEKTYHLVDDKRKASNIILEDKNQECCFSDMSSNTQVSSQSNEAISLLTQIPSQSNEAMDSIIQMISQSNEAEDPLIQTFFHSSEVMNPEVQIPSQSIESESIDLMIQALFQLDENINSMVCAPFMPNSSIEVPLDA
ncbi:NAC domain-containing protein 71-like isoform X1 [Neltuma alba]|uniref:NAC domain-containing protein 71-like isoform X1 n=1 Tax=Neltuma alba TaxID=207710 RepID=UPI0010A599F0|nr:NAC domain-containing protein 71-like isoform X1 [Prosopis alba]